VGRVCRTQRSRRTVPSRRRHSEAGQPHRMSSTNKTSTNKTSPICPPPAGGTQATCAAHGAVTHVILHRDRAPSAVSVLRDARAAGGVLVASVRATRSVHERRHGNGSRRLHRGDDLQGAACLLELFRRHKRATVGRVDTLGHQEDHRARGGNGIRNGRLHREVG
jgi:hypothetical protein